MQSVYSTTNNCCLRGTLNMCVTFWYLHFISCILCVAWGDATGDDVLYDLLWAPTGCTGDYEEVTFTVVASISPPLTSGRLSLATCRRTRSSLILYYKAMLGFTAMCYGKRSLKVRKRDTVTQKCNFYCITLVSIGNLSFIQHYKAVDKVLLICMPERRCLIGEFWLVNQAAGIHLYFDMLRWSLCCSVCAW